MYHFCTYFDANYLPRGLALYQSLERNCRTPFTLWVLCMDAQCLDILSRMGLHHVRLISLPEFEEGDTALIEAKGNRSRVEYYFTCTPSLPLHVLNHAPEVQLITYLDADLYFLSDPEAVFAEFGEGSVLAIEHRHPPGSAASDCATGIYNVGYLSFRRDTHGLACLRWWRERCLEWCYDRVEESRFADQKYLDRWPELFPNVVVLQQKGAGLAPWNLGNYALRRSGRDVLVDGDRLVFYHFHGLKQVSRWEYDTHLWFYGASLSSVARDVLYRPYLLALHRAARQVRALAVEQRPPAASLRPLVAAETGPAPAGVKAPRLLRRTRSWAGRLARGPHRANQWLQRVRRGDLILVFGGRAW